MNCNILIINAILLENPGSGAITAQGFLAINGRLINQIDQMDNLPRELKADKIIDAAGCLVCRVW